MESRLQLETSSPLLPWQLRVVAVLLLATAGLTVVGTVQAGLLLSDSKLRLLGVALKLLLPSILAWGLWHRARWSWWASTLFLGLLTFMSAVAFCFFLLGSFRGGRGLELMAEPRVLSSMIIEAAALVLLVHPVSRTVFKSRAA